MNLEGYYFMTIAVAINALNDKGIKYKVMPGEQLYMAFGLIMNGEKGKVLIFPNEENIRIAVQKSIQDNENSVEKVVDEAGLNQFLDTVLEIKSVQEKDAELVKQEVEASLVNTLIA